MRLTPFPIALKDGSSVLIREVTPEDRHLLEIGFGHLSNQSRSFRFLAARHDLTASELDVFTASNGPDHVAVGALVLGASAPEPVGIARYVRLPDLKHTAELAVTIVDKHQRQGLGSLLLGVLAKYAHLNRISEFYALVHRNNTAMLRLLAKIGGTQTSLDGAEIEVRVPIVWGCSHLLQSSVTDAFTKVAALTDIGPDQNNTTKTPATKSLRQQTSGFTGADQPLSVWLDDGGAID